MPTIRRYTPADQPAVEFLHVFAMQQTGAYLGRGPWEDDVYTIEEVYLNNQGEFLIGECDGLLVAMGALKRTSPERAEIKRMRVHPAESTTEFSSEQKKAASYIMKSKRG